MMTLSTSTFLGATASNGAASSGAAHAQSYAVDFSRGADFPLVKAKFGVYQTPLVTLPRLLDSVPLLHEMGARDLRYETGWGKPDVLAFDQIGGTRDAPTYDFSSLDAFLGALQKIKVQPLLALTYCPTPLQTRTEWARWKDLPSDLPAWERINRDYVAHLKTSHPQRPPFYEVWNEPDMPEPDGKMFFSGNAEDYGRLYARSAAGVRAGDSNALVGGPAAAWNLDYLRPVLSQPIDFASIHGYNNYSAQIAMMRGALKDRPELPIFLTEYASFTDFPPNGPQSRSEAALRFFRDAKGLLRLSDVTKIYWAQWLDAGNSPGMGLVTYDGHRKAIFNAFKIYADLPVDRNFVAPQSTKNEGQSEEQSVDLMASSDSNRAGVVLWNSGDTARDVTVELKNLPFSRGTLQVMRIDAQNASYVDNPAAENLQILQSQPLSGTHSTWQGAVAARGVVYLRILAAKPQKIRTVRIGDLARTHYNFPNRESNSYADFDGETSIARLGTGNEAGAVQIGALIENPRRQFRVATALDGATSGARCELRLSFQLEDGTYSTLKIARVPGKIDLSRLAPHDWNQSRVRFDFGLEGPPQSRVRFDFLP
ncbi:Glycosyl hydrolases family 39 [Abditibacterium utsteinense]|uniref:Glycosyl hydrolases family 39 n=1 Tax=Abditibacterium utsteinense TaxID=1960156 RepID=A0A2S8SS11_9BACT|nr:glycosyl hydrolase [Abditibacterium utsteinense]PQV63591.1 Glycosyl hydrolases family 39 [Abditibacterium utsteinense]